MTRKKAGGLHAPGRAETARRLRREFSLFVADGKVLRRQTQVLVRTLKRQGIDLAPALAAIARAVEQEGARLTLRPRRPKRSQPRRTR